MEIVFKFNNKARWLLETLRRYKRNGYKGKRGELKAKRAVCQNFWVFFFRVLSLQVLPTMKYLAVTAVTMDSAEGGGWRKCWRSPFTTARVTIVRLFCITSSIMSSSIDSSRGLIKPRASMVYHTQWSSISTPICLVAFLQHKWCFSIKTGKLDCRGAQRQGDAYHIARTLPCPLVMVIFEITHLAQSFGCWFSLVWILFNWVLILISLSCLRLNSGGFHIKLAASVWCRRKFRGQQSPYWFSFYVTFCTAISYLCLADFLTLLSEFCMRGSFKWIVFNSTVEDCLDRQIFLMRTTSGVGE